MSLKVKDIMVRNVITIGARATVKKAVEVMDKHEIGCLIVMNRGNPIGIITERDMLKRVLLKLKDPSKTRVSNIMSKPLMVGKPETDVHEAVRLMNERKIKRLPVFGENRLLGLLSLTDVIRSLPFLEHVITSLCSRCRWAPSQPRFTQRTP